MIRTAATYRNETDCFPLPAEEPGGDRINTLPKREAADSHTTDQDAHYRSTSRTAADSTASERLNTTTDNTAVTAPAADTLCREAEVTADSTTTSDPAAILYPTGCNGEGVRPLVGFPTHDGTILPQWRDTTVSAVFGTHSTLATPAQIAIAPPEPITDDALFQSLILVLATLYALLLSHNMADVRSLLGRISRDTTSSSDRISEDSGNNGFPRFLKTSAVIGLLFLGTTSVKYTDLLLAGSLEAAIPQNGAIVLSLLATLVWLLVIAYQLFVMRLAGAITLSQPLMAQLLALKRNYFALGVILVSPPLLLFTLSSFETGGVWFTITTIETILVLALYLRETFNLFLGKKISILHWFLYLCAVEVFPISLLWLIAAR